jgi:hypothetical protein
MTESEFKSSGKSPYSRLLTLLFLLGFLCGLVLVFDIGAAYLAVVFVAILPPMAVFALSPLLTRQSIGPGGIRLRQGWYFSALIPASNIREMALTEEEAPRRSLSYSPRRRRLFVTLSGSPLVLIELKEAARMPFSSRQPVQSVVVSVDDAEGFLAQARRTMQVRVLDESLCPHCRQPLPHRRRPEERQAATAVRHPAVEYIFLIHHDGRLIFQYTGGRLKPVSTSIVSGMLIVVQDFIRDAFKTEGGALRTLEHGDLTVLIESGGITYLAVVVSGQEIPNELRVTMKRVLKEAEQDFGDVLRVWDGSEPEGIGKVVSQVLWT